MTPRFPLPGDRNRPHVAIFAALALLVLTACGTGEAPVEDTAQASGPELVAEQFYLHLASGDYRTAAELFEPQTVTKAGSVDALAERLEGFSDMTRHGDIDFMSHTTSPPESHGVMVTTKITFEDRTVEEKKAWVRQDSTGQWRING